MKALLLATALAVSGSLLAAQEGQKPVPKDSARVTLTGCATGRTFIVGPRTEHGATNVDIAPGRRFRLNGKKEVLERIKSNEDRMVEVTGLIRRDDLKPRGVSLAGGRIKVGGADPRAPVGGGSVVNSPNYDQVTMDVESSRSLVEKCPA